MISPPLMSASSFAQKRKKKKKTTRHQNMTAPEGPPAHSAVGARLSLLQPAPPIGWRSGPVPAGRRRNPSVYRVGAGFSRHALRLCGGGKYGGETSLMRREEVPKRVCSLFSQFTPRPQREGWAAGMNRMEEQLAAKRRRRLR